MLLYVAPVVDSYRATASALNSSEQSFSAIGGLLASSGSSRSSISVSTLGTHHGLAVLTTLLTMAASYSPRAHTALGLRLTEPGRLVDLRCVISW